MQYDKFFSFLCLGLSQELVYGKHSVCSWAKYLLLWVSLNVIDCEGILLTEWHHYCFGTLHQSLFIKISLTYNCRIKYWVIIFIGCWIGISLMHCTRRWPWGLMRPRQVLCHQVIPLPVWLILFYNNKYMLDICFLLIIFKFLHINVYEITVVTEWVQNYLSSLINWVWFYRYIVILENKVRY